MTQHSFFQRLLARKKLFDAIYRSCLLYDAEMDTQAFKSSTVHHWRIRNEFNSHVADVRSECDRHHYLMARVDTSTGCGRISQHAADQFGDS